MISVFSQGYTAELGVVIADLRVGGKVALISHYFANLFVIISLLL